MTPVIDMEEIRRKTMEVVSERNRQEKIAAAAFEREKLEVSLVQAEKHIQEIPSIINNAAEKGRNKVMIFSTRNCWSGAIDLLLAWCDSQSIGVVGEKNDTDENYQYGYTDYYAQW